MSPPAWGLSEELPARCLQADSPSRWCPCSLCCGVGAGDAVPAVPQQSRAPRSARNNQNSRRLSLALSPWGPTLWVRMWNLSGFCPLSLGVCDLGVSSESNFAPLAPFVSGFPGNLGWEGCWDRWVRAPEEQQGGIAGAACETLHPHPSSSSAFLPIYLPCLSSGEGFVGKTE